MVLWKNIENPVVKTNEGKTRKKVQEPMLGLGKGNITADRTMNSHI